MLDLARFIAAMAIALYHYVHFLPAGAMPNGDPDLRFLPWYGALRLIYERGDMAVQFFWALSGFVFAHAYLADPQAWSRFWPARFARLWPLHLLTLALMGMMETIHIARFGSAFVNEQGGWAVLPRHLLLMQMWWQPEDFSFNKPTWSLSVELAIYVVFWLLLPLLRRSVVVAPALLLATCFVAERSGLTTSPLITCAVYFFFGVALYGAALRGWLQPRLAFAALLAIAGAHLVMWISGQPTRIFTLEGISLALLALVALELAWTQRADGTVRFMQWLGDGTFGIYLWHLPLQLAIVLALGGVVKAQPVIMNSGFLVVYALLSIAAGLASHRWFERPAQIALLRTFQQRRKAVPEAG